MQTIWIFKCRQTGKVFTDCVADSLDELLSKASAKYGRTAEQWRKHEFVEPVGIKIAALDIVYPSTQREIEVAKRRAV